MQDPLLIGVGRKPDDLFYLNGYQSLGTASCPYSGPLGPKCFFLLNACNDSSDGLSPSVFLVRVVVENGSATHGDAKRFLRTILFTGLLLVDGQNPLLFRPFILREVPPRHYVGRVRGGTSIILREVKEIEYPQGFPPWFPSIFPGLP